MEVKSTKIKVKNIAQSPQKLRLVADMLRGKSVSEALDILQVENRKGIKVLKEAMLNAIASAKEMFNVDEGDLVISHLSVDEAPILKRWRFASKGRVSRIKKRRSHINLELSVK
ncbi:MAG: 50S ribosomal protein L22 [Candidatus Dojkabacteria bacterium]